MNDLNEKLYERKLSNGLKVTIIKKNDFKKVSAAFCTNFGGAYQKIKVKDEVVSLPLGVAHFLEHKLFASSEGEDITYKFENIGLEVNAYTDYFNTVYYFSGTNNIYEGINMLIDFVQTPHFTSENVESEKGIIEQELLMYQDIPNEALSFGLMNNIFHNYPYIYDVGGTIEDVYKIDKDILYYCYDLFYHPQNMNLVVVGNVDPDRMFDFIEENQKKKVFKEYLYPQLVIDEESDDVVRNYDCKEMDITNSKVIIGFKLPMRKSNITRNQLIIEDIYYRIIRNILFGNHTNFSQKLLDDKVILGPLSSGYNGDNYTQYFSVLGETNNPDAFIKRVKKRMNDLKHLSFSNREVSRIKKDLIGKFIISLNSIDAIMGDYLESLARDYNFFDFIDIVNQINIETLRKISKTLLNLPNSVFVIKPNKKGSVKNSCDK